MAADVFGRGVDGDVGTVIERPKVERRGPRVVDHDDGAALVRDARDRRNVLDLEGIRAGRLQKDDAGLRSEELGDALADARIEVGGLDVHRREQTVAERARGIVDRVRDEHVIARVHEREDGARARRESRAHADGRVSALELGHRLLEGVRRLRSHRAVVQLAWLIASRARAVELVERVEEDGRRTLDGNVDRTSRRAARVRQGRDACRGDDRWSRTREFLLQEACRSQRIPRRRDEVRATAAQSNPEAFHGEGALENRGLSSERQSTAGRAAALPAVDGGPELGGYVIYLPSSRNGLRP